MTDNVIQFPNTKINQNELEALRSSLAAEKENEIEMVVQEFISNTIEKFILSGINLNLVNDEKYVKDIVLLMDAIRSLLYRYYDMEHPLHKHIEKLYKIKEQASGDDNITVFEISSNLDEPTENE